MTTERALGYVVLIFVAYRVFFFKAEETRKFFRWSLLAILAIFAFRDPEGTANNLEIAAAGIGQALNVVADVIGSVLAQTLGIAR